MSSALLVPIGGTIAVPVLKFHIRLGVQRQVDECGFVVAFRRLFPDAQLRVDLLSRVHPEEPPRLNVAVAQVIDSDSDGILAEFRGGPDSGEFIERFDENKRSVEPSTFLFNRVA